MARRPASARERLFAFGALGVVMTWAVVSHVGVPLWERMSLLQQQATLSEEKTARLRELLRRKPLIEQQHATYTHFWSDESDELIQGAFLDQLEQMAEAAKLHLSVKPRPISQIGKTSRFEVELEVDATQESLLTFLDQLLRWPHLIEIVRLRISTTVSKEYPLRATLVVNKAVFHRLPAS